MSLIPYVVDTISVIIEMMSSLPGFACSNSITENIKNDLTDIKNKCSSPATLDLTDPEIREWVAHVNDLFYMVDDLRANVAMLSKQSKVMSLLTPSNLKLHHQLKQIQTQLLSEVKPMKNVKMLHSREAEEVEAETATRDYVKDTVVPHVISVKEGDVGAVVIRGITGLGKRRAAKYVCEDKNVKNFFDVVTWIDVAQGQENYAQSVVDRVKRELEEEETKNKSMVDHGLNHTFKEEEMKSKSLMDHGMNQEIKEEEKKNKSLVDHGVNQEFKEEEMKNKSMMNHGANQEIKEEEKKNKSQVDHGVNQEFKEEEMKNKSLVDHGVNYELKEEVKDKSVVDHGVNQEFKEEEMKNKSLVNHGVNQEVKEEEMKNKSIVDHGVNQEFKEEETKNTSQVDHGVKQEFKEEEMKSKSPLDHGVNQEFKEEEMKKSMMDHGVKQEIKEEEMKNKSVVDHGVNHELKEEEMKTKDTGKGKGKGFLVVLDDFHNENKKEWPEMVEKLKEVARTSSRGFVLLVTTRSETVVKFVTDSGQISFKPVKRLYQLYRYASVSLFEKIAGASWSAIEPKTRSTLLGMCGGVLGAVDTMARLVGSRQPTTESEINKLKQKFIQEMQFKYCNELNLRDWRLRQCFFSSLLILSSQKSVNREKLLQFWMAEGLLGHSSSSSEPEDLGDKCIEKLPFVTMTVTTTTVTSSEKTNSDFVE